MTTPAHPHRLQGILLAGAGAIAFSGKAVIVKLSYRYGVDAVTVLMYRMLFAMPLFVSLSWWSGRGKVPLTRSDWLLLATLGFTGYYLASFLGGTGILIVVGVALDIVQKVESHLLMRHYEGFIKRGKIKGRRG